MSQLVSGEKVTVLSALETTFNTQPSSGWRQHTPDPGGINDFRQNLKKVARSPLSKNRQNEKGNIVDMDANPKLVQSFNKDGFDYHAEGILLAKTKHNGGTASSRFMVAPDGAGAIALSAVAAGAYTVASAGALAQNTLVFARNFGQAANNGGPFVVGAASTATSIKVASAVVEAAPPATAVLEVAGWRGASGDIGLDVNGNLTSTVADFTTMGLVVGQFVWIGGDIGTPALSFATAGYRGFARISAITAHLLSFDFRQWTVAAADTGTGKTIDVYWGRYLRNVAIDNADFLDPNLGNASYQLEMSLPGAAAAAATAYKYMQGQTIDTYELNAPLTSLIMQTITYCGMSATVPGTTRATGASTATAPIAQQGVNTTSQLLLKPAIYDTTNSNAVICNNVSSWKLTLQNNMSALKQQGTLGGAAAVIGKCTVGLDLEVYYVQTDVEAAIGDNRTCAFRVGLRNGEAGWVFDIPAFTIDQGDVKVPANGPVTIAPKAEAFRDATNNVTLGVTLFPYLPSA